VGKFHASGLMLGKYKAFKS